MPNGNDVREILRRANLTSESVQNVDLDAIATDSFEEISEYGGEDEISAVEQLSSVSFGSTASSTGAGGDGIGSSGAQKLELEMLRMELRRRNDELDTLRQQSRILQGQIAASDQRASRAESHLEQERAHHKTAVTELEKRHAEKVAETLKSHKHEIDRDMKLVREQTEALRASFLPLQLSTERCIELKGIPQDELSLQDWIQLQVHDHVSSTTNRLEVVRRERDVLQSSLGEKSAELDHALQECARLTQAVQSCEAKLDGVKQHYESEAESLRLRTAEAERRLNSVAERERTYDETFSALERVQKELRVHTEERNEAVSKAQALQTQASNAAALQQAMELLKMDKMYLSREVETLKDRASRSEANLDVATAHVEKLKAEKQELYDRLIAAADQSGATVEKKVSEELSRLQDRAERDVQAAQKHAKEMYERENMSLRESREAARHDAERQAAALKQLQEAHVDLEVEYRSLQATAEAQLAEVNGRLKMKAFDNERLMLQADATKSELEQIKLDNSKWAKKFEVLKEEYYTLKAENLAQIAELRSRLTSTSKSLEEYELIEAELDSAIVAGGTSDDRTLELQANLATSTKRRVSQALGLAKQLTDVRQEHKLVLEQLQQMREDKDALAAETDRLVATQAQPQSFLLKQLEGKDRELVQLREKLQSMTEAINRVRAQRDAAVTRETLLAQDVDVLIKQRSEVKALKAELQNATIASTFGSETASVNLSNGATSARPATVPAPQLPAQQTDGGEHEIPAAIVISGR